MRIFLFFEFSGWIKHTDTLIYVCLPFSSLRYKSINCWDEEHFVLFFIFRSYSHRNSSLFSLLFLWLVVWYKNIRLFHYKMKMKSIHMNEMDSDSECITCRGRRTCDFPNRNWRWHFNEGKSEDDSTEIRKDVKPLWFDQKQQQQRHQTQMKSSHIQRSILRLCADRKH